MNDRVGFLKDSGYWLIDKINKYGTYLPIESVPIRPEYLFTDWEENEWDLLTNIF